MIDKNDIENLKAQILTSGLSISQLVYQLGHQLLHIEILIKEVEQMVLELDLNHKVGKRIRNRCCN